MATTYRYGSGGYGRLAYAGGAGSGPGGGGGLATNVLFLEANDRQQAVICIGNGTTVPPIFVYWNPAVAPWSEALATPNPADYPEFFLLDGAGGKVSAVLESKVFEANPDDEVQIAGVYADFTVRPSIMDSYDGGPGAYAPTFSIKTRGWGVAGITSTGVDSLTTHVVESPVETWTAANAADVSADPWPAHETAWLPCRLEQSVTAYQVIVTDAFAVEFVRFRIAGVRRNRRKG